jgi:hypothetical protein
MSDIKQVNMTIPIPVKTRRTRKSKAELPDPVITSKPAPTPTIPVAQAAGGPKQSKTLRGPVVVKQGGDPLPSLSTTSVVGGKKKAPLPIALPNNVVKTLVKNEPTPVKIVASKKSPVQARKTVVNQKVKINPIKRKNQTLKKKFVAKKITIHVENAEKINKIRENINKRVDSMDLAEITKKLRVGGMIRECANPPEMMQRAMMRDILNFPTPL